MKGPSFYSKILLFGEYGIIENSQGLSIPYNFYNGMLKIEGDLYGATKDSNQKLREFYQFLVETNSADKPIDLDFSAFYADLEAGMFFDSTIPQGYGVGSSGALVAAVYDKYALAKITVLENLTQEKLLALKQIFSTMEAFFHGKSSGLDPLNSYLSLPILIKSKTRIEATGIPHQTNRKGAIFLLDSGIVGETAPMVELFLFKMKEQGFRTMVKNKFIKHTNACINHFLKGDFQALFGDLKHLSRTVLEHFKPMIPHKLHEVWQAGIDTNSYYLKLCGSGGGGYVLGFTEDYEKARELLKNYRLEVVYTF